MTNLSILLTASIAHEQQKTWDRACRLLYEATKSQSAKLQVLAEAAIDLMEQGPHGREMFRKTCEGCLITGADLAAVAAAVDVVFEAWPEGKI